MIGEIEAGREYFVRRGAAMLRVSVVPAAGRLTLATDPTESVENGLHSLPECR